MRVRFPLAAPRHVEFKTISCRGRESPTSHGYTIIPVYELSDLSERHQNNIEWIEETLTDSWSWFVFSGMPDGISYCFKSKFDAGMFICFKDGTHVIHHAKKE